jgi:hypothetical protein
MFYVQLTLFAVFVCASCTTAGRATPILTAREASQPPQIAADRLQPMAAESVASPAEHGSSQPPIVPAVTAAAATMPQSLTDVSRDTAPGMHPEPCDGQSATAEMDAVPATNAELADASALLGGEEPADERFVDVVSEQGQRAHGLYFTALMTRRLGAAGIIKSVRGAGLDAAVIDIKDQDGRVSYDTHVEALAPERQIVVRDMPGLLRQLKSAGIYAIARIVCFSDPVLPRVHPELAVMDSRPHRAGQIWNQRKTNTWLDPYNPKNHDMVVEIATEAESLGFDEIQLDYIRFPVDEGTKFAMFPAQGQALRRDVLVGLLSRVDAALHIPLGVDVFGLTTIRRGDPAGLGQSLEDWAKYVEVFTPMLYVNGMKTWMRRGTEKRAGLLVEVSVRALRQRVGATPVIRPFLQAFENGADYYNGAFIAEQIHGARVGGGDGFLFWHPASSYGIVRTGMASGGRQEVPFSISERRFARMRRWGQSEPTSEPHATLVPALSKPSS